MLLAFGNFSLLNGLVVCNVLEWQVHFHITKYATDQSDLIINFLDQSCHIQCVI